MFQCSLLAQWAHKSFLRAVAYSTVNTIALGYLIESTHKSTRSNQIEQIISLLWKTLYSNMFLPIRIDSTCPITVLERRRSPSYCDEVSQDARYHSTTFTLLVLVCTARRPGQRAGNLWFSRWAPVVRAAARTTVDTSGWHSTTMIGTNRPIPYRIHTRL